MSETHSEAASANAGIDLSQFYQVFFEEAGENLDRMEQQLLEIDIETADDETLNSIFRCAHSVKGGAATFGFSDVAELTHQMETLLDKLRRHELEPSAMMVDVLLQAGDALKAQLARHQNGGEGDSVDTRALVDGIRAMSAGEASSANLVAGIVGEPRRRYCIRTRTRSRLRNRSTRPCRCRAGGQHAAPRTVGRSARPARTRRQPGRSVQGDRRPRNHRAAGRRPVRRRHAALQGRHHQQRRGSAGPVLVPCCARERQAVAADGRLRLLRARTSSCCR